MGSLKERLRADLTSAMKARDSVRAGTLRMVLTAITNAEVAGKTATTLTDEQVTDVLTREQKRRREAAEAFGSAGRTEMADKERTEGKIIAEYLPEQLTEAEISAIVREAIAASGADGPKAMGQVMGAVQPKVKGRADGGVVAAEVRRQLAG